MSRQKEGRHRTVKSLVNDALEHFENQELQNRSKRSQLRKSEIRKQRVTSLLFNLGDAWLRALEGKQDLPELTLVDVLPHPFVDQFLLVIRVGLDLSEMAPIQECLQKRIGVLRTMLADSMQSKGTPTLSIELLAKTEIKI